MILKYNGENYITLRGKLRSCFIFKENHIFVEEEHNPSEKVVIVEEELDSTGNLEDLSRLVFIDKECGNLKVFVDSGDLTRNINQKKPYVLQACGCPLRDRFHQ